MEPEKLKIKVNERDSVTGLLYLSSKSSKVETTLLLGHGAGADQQSEFMRLFATGLAARGLDTMTFNFLYAEQGRRSPDPNARLESCFTAAIETAVGHKKLKDNRLMIGGKSMGGRIASQVAAIHRSGRLAGLVFLGYPLHAPGKPDQLKDQHFADIRAPLFFAQGSRDAFGSPEELRGVIKRLRLKAKLYVIEGGDHSFKVPKNAGSSQQQIYDAVMDEISSWVSSIG